MAVFYEGAGITEDYVFQINDRGGLLPKLTGCR
jgi:hypothetical protein